MRKNKFTVAVMATAMAAVILCGCGSNTGDMSAESKVETSESPAGKMKRIIREILPLWTVTPE